MFFADPPAALAEMRRVLERGGRAGLSVWEGLDRHPFYRTLHEVIQRRAGVSALELIFSMSDARELRRRLENAGFREIAIAPASKVARFPNPAGFLAGEIDKEATVKAVADGWSELNDEIGKDQQLEFYKATIGAK